MNEHLDESWWGMGDRRSFCIVPFTHAVYRVPFHDPMVLWWRSGPEQVDVQDRCQVPAEASRDRPGGVLPATLREIDGRTSLVQALSPHVWVLISGVDLAICALSS